MTCLWAELQPWCLSFSEGPALGQNTDDEDDDLSYTLVYSIVFSLVEWKRRPDDVNSVDYINK